MLLIKNRLFWHIYKKINPNYNVLTHLSKKIFISTQKTPKIRPFDLLPLNIFLKNTKTGPFTPETHWKQTVFYTDKDLMLEQDDLIKGTIKVQRNPKNFREIDIFLSSFNVGREKLTQQQRWYYLR